MSITAPTDISGCNLWLTAGIGQYDATTGGSPVADGAPIARWEDQSGSANHATQATTANAPTWDATAAEVQFAASADQKLNLPSAYPINSQSFSIFFIAELINEREGFDGTALQDNHVFVETASDVANFYYPYAGNLRAFGNTGGAIDSGIRPSTTLCLIGLTAGGTATNFYINGANTTQGALAAAAVTGGAIGSLIASSSPAMMSVKDVIAYTRPITTSEQTELLAWAQTNRGVATTYTAQLAIDGDSLSIGVMTTGNQNWLRQMDLPNAVRTDNCAQASFLLTDAVSAASSVVDPQRQSGVPTVTCVWLGTNDIALSGDSASTVYANLQSYCSARKSAGWSKVVVFTMLPRNSTDAARASLNASILSGFSGGTLACDAVVDVGGDSRIGQAGQNTNTTYYATDQIHLNNAGQAIVASLAASRIVPLLAATGYTLSVSGVGLSATATLTIAAGATWTGDQSATIAWADGNTTTLTPTAGQTSASANHAYAAAGTFSIAATNAQGWTNPASASFTAIVPSLTASITDAALERGQPSQTISLASTGMILTAAPSDYTLSNGGVIAGVVLATGDATAVLSVTGPSATGTAAITTQGVTSNTLAVQDTTAPPEPSIGLGLMATSYTVRISWGIENDAFGGNVASYTILHNGAAIATVTDVTTSYVVTGVADGDTLGVEATDPSGNVSPIDSATFVAPVIPSARDVRAGTAVNNTTGTLAVPLASQVLTGIAVDAGVGTIVMPVISTVLRGTGYGAAGSQYRGTLAAVGATTLQTSTGVIRQPTPTATTSTGVARSQP